MICDPIAVVRSCFGGKFGVPRQPGLCPSARGEVVFHEKYRSLEAVRGIEGFSHLWLIFGFHETVAEGWRPTVRPPRLGGDERVGVFASRSTYRPNGLGLSLVKLEEVDRNHPMGPVLRIGGLDLIDGTPVYDIKPYLSYAESVPEAVCGYAAEVPARLPVEIDPAARDAFGKLSSRARAVISEALSLDPRPAVRTGDEERVFGATLCDHNVRFLVAGGVCQVVEIGPTGGSELNS
jgi:tRNA (adenine37-N6)-methyltransferase